jgi:hypothetical protein
VRRRALWITAGALAVLLLLWVTAADPVSWVHAPQRDLGLPLGHLELPNRPHAHPSGTPTWRDRVDGAHRPDASTDPADVISTVLLVAVLAVAGLLVLRWLLGRLRSWWGGREREENFDLVPDEGAVATQVLRGAERQVAALAEGPPRDAIVLCWVRLEEDAGGAGLPRHPWETSAEFTRRVITSQLVGSTAIGQLAALYREARFSRHPMSEQDRATAREALATVHASLRRARHRDADRATTGSTSDGGTS